MLLKYETARPFKGHQRFSLDSAIHWYSATSVKTRRVCEQYHWLRLRNPSARIPFATVVPPTYWKMDMTHSTCCPGGVRTVQELLVHKDVQTTMIYTHVLNRGPKTVRSLLDDR